MNRVYQAMAEEDWEVALEELAPALKKKKNYEAKWLAAQAHANRYRFDESFRLFEESLPYAEEDGLYWVTYARAYLFSGDVDNAERLIRRTNADQLEEYAQPFYYEVFNNIQNSKKYLADPKEVIIKNLGDKVNSEGNEYSQVVTSNQRGIFFTARRKGLGQIADDGENYEMILVAEMNEFDNYVNDKPLEGYAGDDVFEAPLQLLDNDSTMITFFEDDVYRSRLQKDGTWGEREPLPINTGKWEPHAFIYNDGNSIIYASSMGNNEDNSDLYVVHKDANGNWTSPYFIEELNTPKREDAPYVAGDGTLYFASAGHDSMGGYDIFKTTLDSATGVFSKPENLGSPINTQTDDTFWTVYGKSAYFSSSRPGGYGQVDIYRIILFTRSKVRGKILTCDGDVPVTGATVTVKTDKEEFSTMTDANGFYEMIMPIEQDFQMTIVQEEETIYNRSHNVHVLFRDEFDINQDFKVGCEDTPKDLYIALINSFDLDPENPDVEVVEVVEVVEEVEVVEPDPTPEVEVAIVPANDLIELPNVYFDFDLSNVKPEFYERLDEAAELLKSRSDLRVMVAGHTDAYGTDAYNIALGQGRYTQVYNYLVNKGVNPEQLATKTFSEDSPVSTNRTISGRAFNRRVELYFIDENNNPIDK